MADLHVWPEALTAAEAAAMIGVSVDALMILARAGMLATEPTDDGLRFSVSAVATFASRRAARAKRSDSALAELLTDETPPAAGFRR